MKNIITILFAVLTFTAANAQEQTKSKEEKKGIVETTFKVEGVCGQCKERIENAAMRTKGVKLAEWNKETKDLKLVYNTKKVSEEEIHQAVADQGHQTPLVDTDTTTYEKLPNCCKYKHGAKCAD